MAARRCSQPGTRRSPSGGAGAISVIGCGRSCSCRVDAARLGVYLAYTRASGPDGRAQVGPIGGVGSGRHGHGLGPDRAPRHPGRRLRRPGVRRDADDVAGPAAHRSARSLERRRGWSPTQVSDTTLVALYLIPFSGIAFTWFLAALATADRTARGPVLRDGLPRQRTAVRRDAVRVGRRRQRGRRGRPLRRPGRPAPSPSCSERRWRRPCSTGSR